jgi:hypothetical protein
METSEFVDMVMSDASPTDLADNIKQMLFDRSVKMIDDVRPYVASQLFDPTQLEVEEE